MKRALVLQHATCDHPGRFLDFFAEDGILPETVRLWEGQQIPGLASYDLLFVLGGPQDTWQTAEYPWLAAEKQAIREWILDRANPFIGVCLGYQLMCDALGGQVALASESEIGVFDIELTEAGLAHPLMRGVPQKQKVIQWHLAEVTRLPPAAVGLASSPRSAVQAAAVGNHAIGTQFHAEVSPQTMATWASIPNYAALLENYGGPDFYRQFLAQAYPQMPQMNAVSRRIYDNLLNACGLRK